MREYAEQYPTARASLLHWERMVLAASWGTPADLKQTFNDVDAVKVASGNTIYVFNIERNAHRLVAAIHFNTGMVFALRPITHKEYDQGYWKAEL
ncbi:MAG: type II toxin-antitoxin system HigB family toxin [Candidatus Latescibacteria bacterium]|nr:type II toxin-antitoxin system HigB family toxin [Candidatus Latescibacterota bacterium]